LIAAVDGIGHGDEAAAAAVAAGAILEAHAADPVTALFHRCHEGLRATRGVVMSVASLDVSQGLIKWLGVGNVEGVLLRNRRAGTAEESLLLRAGVVGHQLPALNIATVPVFEGDTLIFATDGIQSSFARGLAGSQSPKRAAESILARHGKPTDDALVLVVRFLAGHP
jgi:hypothetical protein